MEYIVKKSKRKSIQLKLLSSEVCQISCPLNTTNYQLKEFIDKCKHWISNQQTKCKQEESAFEYYFSHNKVMLYGKLFEVRINNLNKIDTINNILYLKNHNIKQVLKKFAKNDLNTAIEHFAKKMNTEFTNIRLSSAKTKWGSCTNKKSLSFNWKIICLPIELQNYIVIHELAHTKIMNHSRIFWNYVQQFVPDYKNIKSELNNYSFLIRHNL